MRSWKALIAALVLLILLVVPAAAFAGGTINAKGRPDGAKRLSHAVELPNGKLSTMTFTVRTAGGSRVTGYAVDSTSFFGSFNFGGYARVSRFAACSAFRAGYTVRAKLVCRKVSGSGKTYKMLGRAYAAIVGE